MAKVNKIRYYPYRKYEKAMAFIQRMTSQGRFVSIDVDKIRNVKIEYRDKNG